MPGRARSQPRVDMVENALRENQSKLRTYSRSHEFFLNAPFVQTFKKSERVRYEREVESYARCIGLSDRDAWNEIKAIRWFCNPTKDDDDSSWEAEVNDDEETMRTLLRSASRPPTSRVEPPSDNGKQIERDRTNSLDDIGARRASAQARSESVEARTRGDSASESIAMTIEPVRETNRPSTTPNQYYERLAALAATLHNSPTMVQGAIVDSGATHAQRHGKHQAEGIKSVNSGGVKSKKHKAQIRGQVDEEFDRSEGNASGATEPSGLQQPRDSSDADPTFVSDLPDPKEVRTKAEKAERKAARAEKRAKKIAKKAAKEEETRTQEGPDQGQVVMDMEDTQEPVTPKKSRKRKVPSDQRARQEVTTTIVATDGSSEPQPIEEGISAKRQKKDKGSKKTKRGKTETAPKEVQREPAEVALETPVTPASCASVGTAEKLHVRNQDQKAGAEASAPASEPMTPTRSASRPRATPRSSRFFNTIKNIKQSAVEFPALDAPQYGLIQERLAKSGFHLLSGTIFLNKTRGEVAVKFIMAFCTVYETPEMLATASPKSLEPFVRPLGLQHRRSQQLIALAQAWVKDPPAEGRRCRRLDYPNEGAGTNVRPFMKTSEDDDPRVAFEVAHLPGIGPYALDSWRIFCRDALREMPCGSQMTPAQTQQDIDREMQQEWTRVLPEDKELRRYLQWRWLRIGWLWDPLTGAKEKVDASVIRAMEAREIAQYKDHPNPWLYKLGVNPERDGTGVADAEEPLRGNQADLEGPDEDPDTAQLRQRKLPVAERVQAPLQRPATDRAAGYDFQTDAASRGRKEVTTMPPHTGPLDLTAGPSDSDSDSSSGDASDREVESLLVRQMEKEPKKNEIHMEVPQYQIDNAIAESLKLLARDSTGSKGTSKKHNPNEIRDKASPWTHCNETELSTKSLYVIPRGDASQHD